MNSRKIFRMPLSRIMEDSGGSGEFFMLIIYVSSQTIPLQIPLIFLTNTHTLARGKVVRLSGTQTRLHVDYETSSGINPGKGQQRPFFSPRCLLLSPVRQAPPNPTLCRSPVEILNLWKSCVLPHFLLYLGYISDASQVQTLQASLNRSLSTTLHVYGHPTALLAETGILPLYITQNLQLALLRFRLHSSPFATI